ncbi:hypothetical protein BVRB_3g053980 [Beta vulgaris subsp. vulgaris]|uniref:jasmonate-induced protein homolog n=1 Tax=Beta vulgaris subsp. vulgaris TaxID=3555 RepID=UPI00053F9A7D|nr:jasmonate-induced protein homolog [Beta vulgaris subsp. vulgaris]KMT16244.1 hypothetical protein BVRB_3g053980 [Beta vulgaris subsp. vulgaris]
MASEQQAIAKSDEVQHKQIMQELVDNAKSLAMSSKSNIAAANQGQYTVITIKNTTSATLNYYTKHDWFGHVLGSYPQFIMNNSSASFIHVGDPEHGSEGAVVYSGKNKNGIPIGWLLAWDATPNLPEKKVYVECGPFSKYVNIDWSALKAKLEAADIIGTYMDPVTKTVIAAQIVNLGNYVGVGATIGDV